MSTASFIYDDGGRALAGYRGDVGDCACRAVAIATGIPYGEVYAALNQHASRERPSGGRKRSSARNGVHRATMRRYMAELGWVWVPTMGIGTGCKVHLVSGELPPGRLVVGVSRHYVAVVDGVIRDTHDPSRNGKRCVYGYWKKT